MFSSTISPVASVKRIGAFEKKAYRYRPQRLIEGQIFEDALRTVIHMSKPVSFIA